VVPGTAYGLTNEQALGERAAVVRALRADGEVAVAHAREQHRVLADVALEHRAVGEIRGADSCGEVRPHASVIRLAHRGLRRGQLPAYARPPTGGSDVREHDVQHRLHVL